MEINIVHDKKILTVNSGCINNQVHPFYSKMMFSTTVKMTSDRHFCNVIGMSQLPVYIKLTEVKYFSSELIKDLKSLTGDGEQWNFKK